MKRRLIAVARFWYDFIVGDDWRLAVGVATTLALTAVTAALAAPAWWVTALGTVAVLGASVAAAHPSNHHD
jgi:hypothetical protein